jgi:uncharacterized protein (TIGR00299 family) protein
MRTLYFDCFSGISGDMTIGALLDLGLDPLYLQEELAKLDMKDEYELSWSRVEKKGISATKFDVHLKEDKRHDQDHNHDNHNHNHQNHHEQHDHHAHDKHHHRHYKDIVELIKKANFNENVTQMSLNIFKKIGEAEAKIHNIPLEKIHFHEVGAVDSIIDIVGSAILIDRLNIEKIVASNVPVGNGFIKIEHGFYPIPVPATLEILKGVPIQHSGVRGELTTPTGASILSTLANGFGAIPSMEVESIGYGAGTKDFSQTPNVLRVILGNVRG